MALKALLLRKKLDAAKRDLQEERDKMAGIAKREAELAEAINELNEDATEEEKAAVEEAVAELEAEKDETEAKVDDLAARVEEIEAELAKEEEDQSTDDGEKGDPDNPDENGENRGGNKEMNTRSKFYGMTAAEQRNMFAREDVRSFLGTVRAAVKEKRAITGAGLMVPDVFLGLIRENIEEYSKLYKHVNVRQIGGNGTAVVMGTIPEAVWTDCCANLNELDLVFNDAEVACWRVGGYFDVCNANIEDSDLDLAGELIATLGQAIGYALDKAIVFGLGTRMPLGIFTRLAQTEAPADYPATARPWVDLSATNVKSIASSVTGVELFREILVSAAAAKGKYSRGEKVWIMNETTYSAVVAAAMAVDAGGAIVSGVNGAMPVIGGIIEVLDFIPDNVIIGGYADLYLLAERAGTRLDQSEHVHFIQDRTVFRGTARYDGLPVIAEGFVAIGINGTTPSATGITFAPDTANAGE